MGRQPFTVAPNPQMGGVDQVFMYTAASVSPTVSAGEMLFSLISLTAPAGVLLVVELVLLTAISEAEWARQCRSSKRQIIRHPGALRGLTTMMTTYWHSPTSGTDEGEFQWIGFQHFGSL